MKFRQRVAMLGAVAFGCTVGIAPAAAQTAPHAYAVVSEFGRSIVITVAQMQTGTRLEANTNEPLPVKDGTADRIALMAAKQALQQADPGAKVWLVAPGDSDLFDARGSYAEGDVAQIPDDLAAAMKQQGTTHLLLLSRQRAEARFPTSNGSVGRGLIEGLGYYVDRETPMKNRNTLVDSIGFVTPYLYMRATLIDAASGKVIATRRINESNVDVIRGASQVGNVWNSTSLDRKLEILSEMVRTQVGKVVPALLGSH